MLERTSVDVEPGRLTTVVEAAAFVRSAASRIVTDRLAHLGAVFDAESAFPSESIVYLVKLGATALFGRDEDDTDALLAWLRLIGRADLSLGRLFEGHVNAVQLIEWYGTDAQRQTLRRNLASGGIYGVWASEPPPGVTLQATGVLKGRKTFASGTGHIDYAIVTARVDGGRAMVVVPANIAVRADCSAWQVRGMRATMSGSYDLGGLHVAPQDIIGTPQDYDAEPRFTAGAWRFLAVQLGGLEALVAEMHKMMSDAAKNDPLRRLRFADAVEAMRTAQFWVTEAARLFAREAPDAVAFVQMARGAVERAATNVIADAARVIGTRSAFDGQRIDKISRDLSLYLRQAGPDHARDQAALAWLDRDIRDGDARLW